MALTSNCCIGILLLVNHRANIKGEDMTGRMLSIRDRIDTNFRQTIAGMAAWVSSAHGRTFPQV